MSDQKTPPPIDWHDVGFDRARLKQKFACQTPDQMRWKQHAGLFECRGCRGGCCGQGYNNGEFERQPQQAQLL